MDLALEAPRYSQVCIVTAVDSVTMNFLCQANLDVRQYWIARSTRFAGGWPGASFFDLTTGQRVEVTFHNAGRFFIADVVRSLPNLS